MIPDAGASMRAQGAFWTIIRGAEAWTLDDRLRRAVEAACVAYVAEIERRAAE